MMICAICGAPCVRFDRAKWTHKGVAFGTGHFSHTPLPVVAAA